MRSPTWMLVLAVGCGSLVPACGGGTPTSSSKAALPLAGETANFRYFYASGDRVDSAWEEQYHAWATAQLGVTVPRKISYYKYQSRQDMGERTGHYNTNAFALPDTFEIHTLWATDNHEVVHIYTSLLGRPSDFFNEGIAVALQVDPATGDYVARFNGQAVHDACRLYLQSGTLVLPLAGIVRTSDFRAIADSVLSYREAGSFVRFAMDTYGIGNVRQFFQTSRADDDLATIQARFRNAFGATLADVEAAWLAMLRASQTEASPGAPILVAPR